VWNPPKARLERFISSRSESAHVPAGARGKSVGQTVFQSVVSNFVYVWEHLDRSRSERWRWLAVLTCSSCVLQ